MSMYDEVLRKLDVLPNRPFKIVEFMKDNRIFKFTKDSFIWRYDEEGDRWCSCWDHTLIKLLNGELHVYRPPFVPQFGKKYYTYTEHEHETLIVIEEVFTGSFIDKMRCKLGIVFKTREAAVAEMDRYVKLFNNYDRVDLEVLK